MKIFQLINSLPNNKFVDCFKLKAFADDKIYVTRTLTFALRRVENIVGKGEKGWFPAFFSFSHYVFTSRLI